MEILKNIVLIIAGALVGFISNYLKEKYDRKRQVNKNAWFKIQEVVSADTIHELNNEEIINCTNYTGFWCQLTYLNENNTNIKFRLSDKKALELFSTLIEDNRSFLSYVVNNTTRPKLYNSECDKIFQDDPRKPETPDTKTSINEANRLRQTVVNSYNALYKECQKFN